MGMRKTVLLVASMALAMLLVSGVAYAITKNCRAGADFCVGTNNEDTLNGSEVRDRIYGLKADDKLYGNGGNDGFLAARGATS
jgi:Ca2+-binding RTX toxin-like protein